MEMPWCALTTASRGNKRKPASCCDFNIHLEKQSSAGGDPHGLPPRAFCRSCKRSACIGCLEATSTYLEEYLETHPDDVVYEHPVWKWDS